MQSDPIFADFCPTQCLKFAGNWFSRILLQGHSVKTFSVRGLWIRYFYVFFISFCTNSIVQYGRNFILVLSNHIIKKKVGKSHCQKNKISGVAQNGSISADWIFRVANFGFDYLSHFCNNFANSCVHLVANFLNFSKHPLKLIIWWFWRELWTKNQKNRRWKFAIVSQPRNLTFFEIEIFQLFS